MRGRIALLAAGAVALALPATALVASSGADTPPGPLAQAAMAVSNQDGATGDIKRACPEKCGDFKRTADDGDFRTSKLHGIRFRSGESDVTARPQTESQDQIVEASAAARTINVLDGQITAYGARRTAQIVDGKVRYDGRVDGLVIAGRQIGDVTDKQEYDLPDNAGTVFVNQKDAALRIVLDRADGEFPAGTVFKLARVRVAAPAQQVDSQDDQKTQDEEQAAADALSDAAKQAKAARDAKAQKAADAKTDTAAKTKATAKENRATPKSKQVKRKKAPSVRARLTGNGFSFPVFGPGVSPADDYGAFRADTGKHEGNDVFAPFGAPVLAVTDGKVVKVGTLPISGNRLWLVTEHGDAFFYAHLSAFSPTAVNGRHVKAGDVLGFVGNTGDAEPTPPHVHFEVHPGGVTKPSVDPHPFLLAWRDGGDVAPSAWLARNGTDSAQRPGALVEVDDFIARSGG